MGVCSALLDQVILQPTKHSISTRGMTRRELARANRGGSSLKFEVWTQKFDRYAAPRVNVLKLIGAGGRAENASADPLPLWHCGGQVWTVNPPGFGRSPGSASLANCVVSAEIAAETMLAEFPDTPLLLVGVSLGAALALHIATKYPVAALAMRDVPDIRQVIRARYGRYIVSWPWAAAFAQFGIPTELASIANAARCRVPGLFVTARLDRVVPPTCQDKVINAFAGEHRVLPLPETEHGQAIPGTQLREYVELQRWLKEKVIGNAV